MGKYSKDKNIDSLVRELISEGWGSVRGKGHWKLKSPASFKFKLYFSLSFIEKVILFFAGTFKKYSAFLSSKFMI